MFTTHFTTASALASAMPLSHGGNKAGYRERNVNGSSSNPRPKVPESQPNLVTTEKSTSSNSNDDNINLASPTAAMMSDVDTPQVSKVGEVNSTNGLDVDESDDDSGSDYSSADSHHKRRRSRRSRSNESPIVAPKRPAGPLTAAVAQRMYEEYSATLNKHSFPATWLAVGDGDPDLAVDLFRVRLQGFGATERGLQLIGWQDTTREGLLDAVESNPVKVLDNCIQKAVQAEKDQARVQVQAQGSQRATIFTMSSKPPPKLTGPPNTVSVNAFADELQEVVDAQGTLDISTCLVGSNRTNLTIAFRALPESRLNGAIANWWTSWTLPQFIANLRAAYPHAQAAASGNNVVMALRSVQPNLGQA